MNTIVYLANQQIQVLTGVRGTKNMNVKDYFVSAAPEGSIINGIVMDSDSFIDFFMDFWKEHKLPKKDVVLVINSSKFVGKTIEMPTLNPKKTLEFIEREFEDIKKEEENVYGYANLTSETPKMSKVFAQGVPRDLIQDYVELFSAMGIQLKAVHSGQGSLIELVDSTIGKKYKTFVLELADGNTLSTLLWVNGSFYYFNSVRCFHEQGTEDYAIDIARAVSQVTQFMQAHQIEYQLERIVLAGIQASDLDLYVSAILQQGIQIRTELFDGKSFAAGAHDIQYYLYAASGLFVRGKQQNFLSQYAAKKTKKTEGSSKTGFIIIGAVFLGMVIAWVCTWGVKYNKQKELDKIIEYNQSPEVMLDVARYDVILRQNRFLTAQHAAIKDIDENLETYPICDQNMLRIISDCAGDYATTTFESFDANAGVVTIIAKAKDVDNINKFIKRLNQEDIFNCVDYTGYAFDEQTGLWDIHVVCTLAESAGR